MGKKTPSRWHKYSLMRSFRKSKLNQFERQFDIPSVRRPQLAQEEIVQLVVYEAEKDVTQNHGPNYVKAKLKDHDIKVPR